MKVRIINNGEPGHMTKITNAETGELLDWQFVEASIQVFDKIPHAILTAFMPAFDIIADAEIKQVCPCCGKPVRADGRSIEFALEAEISQYRKLLQKLVDLDISPDLVEQARKESIIPLREMDVPLQGSSEQEESL